ncbi:MAG: hypothetical protein OXI26_07520 [bacterium]|nr:hypothetical protein [bacterium]
MSTTEPPEVARADSHARRPTPTAATPTAPARASLAARLDEARR